MLEDIQREKSGTYTLEGDRSHITTPALPSCEAIGGVTDLRVVSSRLFEQDRRLIAAAMKISEVVSQLPAKTEYNLTTPRALVVGGFIRDAAIGLKPKDLDIEVYGVGHDELEALLQELFPGKINYVGQSFEILKVALEDGLEIDVSIPRRESKQGSGHRGFIINGDPSLTIEEAASRRDFSWNAMAACLLTGTVYDPFDGLADLQQGVMRVTDPITFPDDPLRVYRAAQFVARLSQSVDPSSMELMKAMVARGDLTELSQERIRGELKKLLLKSEKPSIGLQFLREVGIVEKYFPEFEALFHTPQDPEWHPEGDVGTHTLMVVDAAARLIREAQYPFTEMESLSISLGALVHDFGKPATTEELNGRICAHGHEAAGYKPASEFLSKFNFPREVERAALACTVVHMKPGAVARQFWKGAIKEKHLHNAVRRIVNEIKPLGWRPFITMTEADSRGRGIGYQNDPYLVGELFSSTVEALEKSVNWRPTLIQGRDLIALGLTPGATFGAIISEVERRRDKGKIESCNAALEFVKKNYLVTADDVRAIAEVSGAELGKIMIGLKKQIDEGTVTNRKEGLAYITNLPQSYDSPTANAGVEGAVSS